MLTWVQEILLMTIGQVGCWLEIGLLGAQHQEKIYGRIMAKGDELHSLTRELQVLYNLI
jgi:hypothetical protein